MKAGTTNARMNVAPAKKGIRRDSRSVIASLVVRVDSGILDAPPPMR
jgi:hypothetical protein